MKERRAALVALIEEALDARLPGADTEPVRVHRAMRHAVNGGGKRLRPLLSLSVAEMLGLDPRDCLDAACAVETAHTASLILDDLPCMDNAAERRGRPCTHKEYGAATAILAALALLSESFHLVASNAERLGGPERAVAAVALLRDALGTHGLVGGQHLDLLHTGGAPVSLETLTSIHGEKAGALFVASALLPGVLSGLDAAGLDALRRFASRLGLAFQISDDLIDARHGGEDAGKCTFASHLGADGAASEVDRLVDGALEALAPWGAAATALQRMAEYVRTRKN